MGTAVILCVCMFVFRRFSLVGCYRLLSSGPCAVLVIFLFYVHYCVSVNPSLLIYPSSHSPSPLVTARSFSVSLFLFRT